MNKRLVFFGNERIATGVTTSAPVLSGLIAAGYDVAVVVVNYQTATSRSSRMRQLEVVEVAEQNHIPVLSPKKLSDITQQLKDVNAQAGILVAYGKIIPKSVIDIFPSGIINIHPSLLPKHRGPTPLESAILAGDSTTGVSIMALAPKMDAGPVYVQQTVDVASDITKQQLADRLISLGTKLLNENLDQILNGNIVPKPQDETLATYDQLISKDDGVIDWHKTAQDLQQQIRAYALWPKSRTVISGVDVVITEAGVYSEVQDPAAIGQIVITPQKRLLVQTADGYLEITKLKPAGKAEMDATSFVNGYRSLLKD